MNYAVVESCLCNIFNVGEEGKKRERERERERETKTDNEGEWVCLWFIRFKRGMVERTYKIMFMIYYYRRKNIYIP